MATNTATDNTPPKTELNAIIEKLNSDISLYVAATYCEEKLLKNRDFCRNADERRKLSKTIEEEILKEQDGIDVNKKLLITQIINTHVSKMVLNDQKHKLEEQEKKLEALVDKAESLCDPAPTATIVVNSIYKNADKMQVKVIGKGLLKEQPIVCFKIESGTDDAIHVLEEKEFLTDYTLQ